MNNLINNRYVLQGVIAEGGSSIVYRAIDTKKDELVAIKRSKNGLQDSEREKWLSEVHLHRQIRLSCVVPIQDYFVNTVDFVSYGYIVQEFISGQTLAEEYSQKRYTQKQVKDIVIELLNIVCQLQELTPPIIHRDLKPRNFMRQSSGEIVLLDFGLAIDDVNADFGRTMGVGTLGYQAPEQIEGYPKLNSDVYSIGVIAVELLSRKSPKDLISGYRLRWQTACSSVSKEWKQWLEKCLAPTDKRFPDAFTALQGLLEPQHQPHPQPKQKTSPSPQNTPNQNPVLNPNTNPSLDILEDKLRDVQTRYEIAWLCIFFFSILAIPFIYYYYKKRKQIQIEIRRCKTK